MLYLSTVHTQKFQKFQKFQNQMISKVKVQTLEFWLYDL